MAITDWTVSPWNFYVEVFSPGNAEGNCVWKYGLWRSNHINRVLRESLIQYDCYIHNKIKGIPWKSSGWDCVLLQPGALVRSLVEELRSHKPQYSLTDLQGKAIIYSTYVSGKEIKWKDMKKRRLKHKTCTEGISSVESQRRWLSTKPKRKTLEETNTVSTLVSKTGRNKILFQPLEPVVLCFGLLEN